MPALVLYHPRDERGAPCARVARRPVAARRRARARSSARALRSQDPRGRADRREPHGLRTRCSSLRQSPIQIPMSARLRSSGSPTTRTRATLVRDGIAALLAGSIADRVALAHAIGYAPHDGSGGCSTSCSRRENRAVMREACGRSRAPQLADLDRLLALLEDPHVRGDVRPRVHRSRPARPRQADRGARRSAHADRRCAATCRARSAGSLAPQRRRARRSAAARARRHDRVQDPARARPHARRRSATARSTSRRCASTCGARSATPCATRRSSTRSSPSRDDAPSAELIRELLAREATLGDRAHVSRARHPLSARRPAQRARRARRAAASAAQRGARDPRGARPRGVRAPLFALSSTICRPRAAPRRASASSRRDRSRAYEAFSRALLADPSESLKCVVAHHVAERHLVALRPDLTRLRPLVGSAARHLRLRPGDREARCLTSTHSCCAAC